jgi:hypothetical protein
MINKIYGLDTRSISAFRFLLSVFIGVEFILMVLGNFHDIYSPETGVLGNCFAEGYQSNYKNASAIFSIHTDVVMEIFVGSIILTMLLVAVGFYSQFFALAGCILLWFFFTRYQLLYFGWEMYASVMLFWLILIPSKWSEGREYRSPFAFALLFQIAFIYFYNGISKNGELWMSGKAIESFLSEVDKARSAADWLIAKPVLTSALTYLTLLIEVGIVILLFTPTYSKKLRYLSSFLIFSLHWGIDIFVDVGNFKYVATAVSVLLLPGDVWDGLAIKFSFLKNSKRIKITDSTLRVHPKVEKILALSLCVFIVFVNLSQTNFSGTNDRMKQVVEVLNLDKFFKKINHHALPQYCFFSQYWHLYSPDPPSETGWMQVEFITTNNDTVNVFNGNLLGEERFHSAAQRNLFNYLLLKKGRNKKDQVAEKCLLMREIKLWNKGANPKISSAQLVIYNRVYEPEKWKSNLQPGFTRIPYKVVDINYKSDVVK